MRTLKSILLAGAMLLATPAFFSSCQEDAPQIDYTMSVTVVNDFSKVVDAINNGTLKNEQAIAQLTAAIDKMNADQQTKLQAIIDVLNSVNATLETITESLVKGDKVNISGFGIFEVKNREARVGRNPRTKETIQIPAAKLPAFKASKTLKDAVSK